MKSLVLLCSALLFLPAGVSAQPPGPLPQSSAAPAEDLPGTNAWHCPDAEFRLEAVQFADKDHFGVVEDRKLCLPGNFDNGVRVFDATGQELKCSFLRGGALLLDKPPKKRNVYVYFGFQDKIPDAFRLTADNLSNRRLTLFQNHQGHPFEPAAWLQKTIQEKNSWLTNFFREQYQKRLFVPCPGDRSCDQMQKQLKLCRNALMPFCARSVFTRHTPPKPIPYPSSLPAHPLESLSFSCCIPLPFLSDWQRYKNDHGVCLRKNFERAQNDCTRHFLRIAKENEALRTSDPTDGLENALFDGFKHNRGRTLEHGRVFLAMRPFDTGERFTVLFKGNLFVEKSGRYAFRVRTNSTRILRIDGKTVLRTFGETPNTLLNGTEDTVEVDLEPGMHLFELCYHKGVVTTFVFAEWKKPGDTRFSTINEEDCEAGYPVRPIKLTARDGSRFPLFSRDDKFALFTQKYTRAVVNSFLPIDEDPQLFSYRVDSTTHSAEHNVIVLQEPDKAGDKEKEKIPLEQHPTVTILSQNPAYAPLPVRNYPRKTPRTLVQANLALKPWTPAFLYDDEILDYTIEISSRLPFPMKAGFRQTSVRQSAELPDFVRSVSIDRMTQEFVDRFVSAIILKQTFPLNGKKIAAHGDNSIRYDLFLPGMQFDTKSIRFVRVKDLPAVTSSDGVLFDQDGARLVVLLHRPTLSELREWEILKSVSGAVRPRKQLLILCENIPPLINSFRKSAEEKGIDAVFVYWKSPLDTPARARAMDAVPEILNAIESTKPDQLLILPRRNASRKTESVREETRILDFLIEFARTRAGIRDIALASPFPDQTSDVPAFTDELRKFKRTRNIRFIELESHLKTTDENDTDFPLQDGFREQFPVGAIPRAVPYLLNAL